MTLKSGILHKNAMKTRLLQAVIGVFIESEPVWNPPQWMKQADLSSECGQGTHERAIGFSLNTAGFSRVQ